MLKLTRPEGRKNWVIRGTIDGRRIHKSTGTPKRAIAEQILRKLEKEHDQYRALGPGATLTFAEAALTYLESGGEERFIKPLLLHFGPDFLLREMTNDAINKAARELYPEAAPNTVQRQLITPISAIYRMAAQDELVPPKIFRRRGKPKARTDWITPEEGARLIEAAREHFPHILRPLGLMLGGGARSSEALRVTVKDWHHETAEAWIPETKSGAPRMIRLPSIAAAMIEEEELPEAGAICLTPKGVPYKIRQNGGGQMKGAFDKLEELAEISIRVTPHVLRHTWATWFHAQTRDFGALLDLGGWERADVANIYRKIAPEDLGDRLAAHGWDFTRQDLRRPAPAPTGRVIQLHGTKKARPR